MQTPSIILFAWIRTHQLTYIIYLLIKTDQTNYYYYFYYYTRLTASSRTTSVSRYEKGKTSMDLNVARDDGVLGCSGISWTTCKQSTHRSMQITTPTSRHPDALPNAQPVSKHCSMESFLVILYNHLTVCILSDSDFGCQCVFNKLYEFNTDKCFSKAATPANSSVLSQIWFHVIQHLGLRSQPHVVNQLLCHSYTTTYISLTPALLPPLKQVLLRVERLPQLSHFNCMLIRTLKETVRRKSHVSYFQWLNLSAWRTR